MNSWRTSTRSNVSSTASPLATDRTRPSTRSSAYSPGSSGGASTTSTADVAIEIDGDPSRQDIDYTLARRAVAAGCLFALDSDAHATEELSNAEIAIAHARLGGVPKERVIDCWPVDELLAWLEKRRAGPKRRRHSARSA